MCVLLYIYIETFAGWPPIVPTLLWPWSGSRWTSLRPMPQACCYHLWPSMAKPWPMWVQGGAFRKSVPWDCFLRFCYFFHVLFISCFVGCCFEWCLFFLLLNSPVRLMCSYTYNIYHIFWLASWMISRFQGRCQQTILMRVCVNNSLTSGSKIFPNIAMYFIGSNPVVAVIW